MRLIYFNYIIQKKREIVKVIAILFLFIQFRKVAPLINDYLCCLYGSENRNYLFRIYSILLIIISLIIIEVKYLGFIKKYYESIALLGIQNWKIFIFFIMSNYEILILQIFWGIILATIYQTDLYEVCITSFINGVLYFLIIIIMQSKTVVKIWKCIFIFCFAFMGVLIGLRKIDYYSIREIVMSQIFTDLFNKYILKLNYAKLSVLFITLIAFAVLSYYGRIQIPESVDCDYGGNWIGDLLHKVEEHQISISSYVFLYRSFDFILWKIFSSVMFVISCYSIQNTVMLGIIVYCFFIVNSFYSVDIYNINQSCLFIYAMSNYTYKKVIKNNMLSGILTLGDFYFAILLVRCICNKSGFIVIIILLILAALITLYLNAILYAEYPKKITTLRLLVLILKMHVPVYNIIYSKHNFQKGEKKWERIDYELLQQFMHK